MVWGNMPGTCPGGRSPPPYRVWVSEIMLQQTRVAAVLGYFAKFMDAFPTVQDLAAAPEDQLMKLWQGLGYYSRARNLQKAARQIVDTFGGVFPTDYGDIRSLAGVGDYTAAAIASISFGQPVPAVDGNLLRVAARVMGDDTDITTTQGKRHFTAALQEIIPLDFPGQFNQAMMDLGAMVCLPNGAPLCQQCPAEAFCQARKQGRTKDLPVRPAKKPRRVEERVVFLLFRGGKVALRRRPGKGLLAGLWEYPNELAPGGGRHGGLGAHGRGDPWRDRGAHLYPCGMAYDGPVLAGEPGAAACGMGLGGPGCAAPAVRHSQCLFPLPGFGGGGTDVSRLSYDPTHCTLCPRRCGGDRTRAKGYCRMPDRPVVARAALHFWEEPPLSGTRGAGTVFFFRMLPGVRLLPK